MHLFALGTATTVDVGLHTGVIVGYVLAAVGVSSFAMVIIIVVKIRRKKDTNETGTANVTATAHYANLVVGNPGEKDITDSAIEEACLHRGMSIGETNSRSGVMEPDVHIQHVYEKLQDVTESNQSAYCKIDHTSTNDQKMDTMKTISTYVENLQSLESTLKNVEEEISVVLDNKEQLLLKELETARANKIRDKWKQHDSDKDKDGTIINFVQALQSIEGELIRLEEKRKCLLGKKEILLRQELANTTDNEK
ncbi:hypothetical protein ACJMK2_032008 [Sinanodonta woodiana]|uniref:Uncharacterized protein n=1 Tax=Sinanodonta woodiana TaxID=1069815 RepID=A0ABD3X0G4_SINWO